MKRIAHLITSMLLGSLLTAFAFTALSKTTSTQDPAKLAPQFYKIIFENGSIRVIDYRSKAGDKEPMHSHPSGAFVYFLTDMKTRTTLPDGKVSEDFARAGEFVWRDPITHAGENIGNAEAHVLLVEPKHACK